MKKKKRARSKNQKRKSFLQSRALLYGCLVIFLILVVLLSVELFDITLSKEQPVRVQAVDECSLVLGNLLHKIKSDSDCRLSCIGECRIQELAVYNYTFTKQEGACNSCECYCA